MKYNISILEYMGSIKNGILTLVSIIYNNKYYEGTFYYTIDNMVLTISEELEFELGHKISDDIDYIPILKDIFKKVAPYHETIDKIKKIC